MEECLFCKIVKNEIPSYKVYEDDSVLAFLDVHPMSRGHTLVIPKNHVTNIFEIDEATLDKISNIAKTIAQKMKDNLGVDGVNLYHASGIHAEQSVFHFHMHVIPRREDDSIYFNGVAINKENISEKELEEVANKLKIGG
jgi:histidine triad (HIT) family protein